MSERLEFSAGLDLAEFISPLKSLESQLQNTQVIFQNFASSFQTGVDSISSYEQSLGTLESAHAGAAESTQQLSEAGATLADSFNNLATSNESVTSSFETIGGTTQTAAGNFETLGSAVEGLGGPLETAVSSFEGLSSTIDGLGSPFSTLAQTTEEYSGVLTSTGDAVVQFEATSATLTDTLTNEQTILTDTQTTTEGYTGALQELEPSIRQVESGVLDSATALDETNTLTENLSGTTETYTGALSNLETELTNTNQVQQETAVQGENVNASFVSLGASSLSLATNVFGLIRNYDNLQKSELSVERAALSYEKAVVATDKAQAAFTESLLKSGNASTTVLQANTELSAAVDAYTALLDQGVTSGAEFESAQENLAFATENMRQTMLNAGFSVEETDIIMGKLSNTIESQYVKSQQLAQRENDLFFNQLNTGFTILGSVASVVSTASDAFSAYSKITQSLIPHINSASIAIGGLSISLRSLLIASGVGIALAALGTIVQAFATASDDTTASVDTLSGQSLPNVEKAAGSAGTTVEDLRKTFLDLYSQTLPQTSKELDTAGESMAKAEEKTSSLQKQLSDLGAAFVKGITDTAAAIDTRLSAAIDDYNNKNTDTISGLDALGIQFKKAFGQASQEELDKLNKHMQGTQGETGKINSLYELLVPKKAEAFNPEPVSTFNTVLASSKSIGEDYTKQIVQNSVERLKNNDIIASLTDSEIANVAATEAAAAAILEQNKTLLEGRQVTTEALLEWDEYKKSLLETPQTVQQVNDKFNELFPTIDKAKLAAEAHVESLTKENEALVEQALQAGVSAESVANFSTHIDENTGKVLENADSITVYNNVLVGLIAETVNVTAAFTDTLRSQGLLNQGFLEGRQSAQDFADQMVRNSEESKAYVAGLKEIATELKVNLDPSLTENAKNYELLLKAQDGTRESAMAYAQAIASQVLPAMQKLSAIGDSVKQGFEQMAQSFESGKKEVMALVDFLPGKLEKQIKVNLSAEVEAQEAEAQLKAAIDTLVTQTESGKFEMRPDIEISPKTAEKTIDAFRDQVGKLIENRPLEQAKWEPLFNQLEAASSLKGQDAVNALEQILTDPANVNLLSGAGVNLGEGTGKGLIEALDKAGIQLPDNIKQAILKGEPQAVEAGAQVGKAGGFEIANEAATTIEGNQDFKGAIAAALEDPSAKNLTTAAAALLGQAAAEESGATIEQDATLSKSTATNLENEASVSATQKAGEKHGTAFVKGFLVSADKSKGDISDIEIFGGVSKGQQDRENVGKGNAVSEPIKVPAPDVTAYNAGLAAMATRATQTAAAIVTSFTTEFAKLGSAFTTGSAGAAVGMTALQTRAAQAAIAITGSFTTEFGKLGTAFTSANAALQSAMTGLTARATITATGITAAFTTEFNKLGAAFTTANGSLQAAMTGLTARATITATGITAAFTTEFNKLGAAFTTANASLQVAMTGLVARAKISAVGLVDAFEIEFKLITPAFGLASAGLQTQMTALVTAAKQRAALFTDAYEAEFKLITPAFGITSAGLIQQMTSLATQAKTQSAAMSAAYSAEFTKILTEGAAMFTTLIENTQTFAETSIEIVGAVGDAWVLTFEETILTAVTKALSQIQQMMTGTAARNEIELQNMSEAWDTTWSEDIVGFVSKASASIQQMVVGIAATVGRETGKMTTEFEQAAEAWVEAVEQAREDMEKEFDKMVSAAEKAAAKIKSALSSARSGGAQGNQFGTDEIVEAGENKLMLIGEGNTRERIRIDPEGTAGFAASDFGGGSSGGGSNRSFSGNVPVNVTINETSHNYMDSEIVSRKVNRRVYKNVSGTLG